MKFLKSLGMVFLHVISASISIGTAVAGTLYHQAWAWNLFAFLTWISFIVMSLLLFGKKQAREEGKAFNPFPYDVVPPFVRRLENFVLACFVAAMGHWFYGFVLFIYLIIEGEAIESLNAPETAEDLAS